MVVGLVTIQLMTISWQKQINKMNENESLSTLLIARMKEGWKEF